MIDNTDMGHLRTAVALAEQALNAGHSPFGSLLVSADGEVLFQDHNRDGDGELTRHPELAIAQWAERNLEREQRASATVYTSGEHCPMCAGAHAWAGLGRIVYVSSAAQLQQWLRDFDAPASPTASLPITDVAPDLQVDGPVVELAEQVKLLQRRHHLGES